MPRNVFAQTFHDLEKPLLFWGLGLAAYALLVLAFYPVVTAYPDFARWLQGLVSSFQSLVGISEPVTSPSGFLYTTSFALILPALLAAFSVLAVDRVYTREQEGGYLDVILSRPVARWRLALQKFAALALAITVITAGLWVVYAWRLTAMGTGVDLGRLAGAMAGLALVSLCFGGLAMIAGTLVQKPHLSRLLTLTGLAIAYIFYLAPHITPALKVLRLLSPFYYGLGSDPLVQGVNLIHIVVLLVLTGLAVAVALVLFERKDLI